MSFWMTKHTCTLGDRWQFPRNATRSFTDYIKTNDTLKATCALLAFLLQTSWMRNAICAVPSEESLSQSQESALHSQVRGHSTAEGPFHSLRPQWQFRRVIVSRKQNAFTITWCSCAVSWGSFAAFECYYMVWGRPTSTAKWTTFTSTNSSSLSLPAGQLTPQFFFCPKRGHTVTL